jgi:hypothetical protein
MDVDCIRNASANAAAVRNIVESKRTIDEKVKALAEHIKISDPKRLCVDMSTDGIDKKQVDAIEHQEEEDAELGNCPA